jgi:hypothetical protein
VRCTGPRACSGSIECGSGACVAACTGGQTCLKGVSCAASCSCNAQCDPTSCGGALTVCPPGCSASPGCGSMPPGCNKC